MLGLIVELANLVARVSAPKPRPPSKSKYKFRPHFESLEERCVMDGSLNWGAWENESWHEKKNWNPEFVPTSADNVDIGRPTDPNNPNVKCKITQNAEANIVYVHGFLEIHATLNAGERFYHAAFKTSVMAGAQLLLNYEHLQIREVFNDSHFFLAGTVEALAFVNGASQLTLAAAKLDTGTAALIRANVTNKATVHVTPVLAGQETAAIGTLTVQGDFSQTQTGSIVIGVKGTTQSDTVVVSGKATLAGDLKIETPPDFMAAANSKFTVMTYGSREGQFANNTWSIGGRNFIANYQANKLVLEVAKMGMATSTTVVASNTPSTYGQSVTFSATVIGPPGQGIPTGEVFFLDGEDFIGSANLNAQGQATFTTTSLDIGSHFITAVYQGDETFSWSESSVLPHSVVKGTTITSLVSSNPMAPVGQPITFTATVTPSPNYGYMPTGTVKFYEVIGGNEVFLGEGILDANGQATFTTSSLSVGSHQIKAKYLGDDNFLESSFQITQVITNMPPMP